MIDYPRILIGALLGLLLGAANFYLMRTFVRIGLKYAERVWGVLIIIFSYLLRYLLIGTVVFYLMRRGETLISLTVLGVLGILTVLLAVWQQRKRAAAGG